MARSSPIINSEPIVRVIQLSLPTVSRNVFVTRFNVFHECLPEQEHLRANMFLHFSDSLM